MLVRIVLAGGVLLLLSFFGVALLLPNNWSIRQEIVIAAQPADIYPYLSDLTRWRDWSAWRDSQDATVTFSYGAQSTGAGASFSWRGDKSGTGELTLVRAEPERGVWYQLSIEEGRFTPRGSITLEPASAGTRVVWIDEGAIEQDIVARYFVPIIKRTLAHNYARALADLKQLVEAERARQH